MSWREIVHWMHEACVGLMREGGESDVMDDIVM